MKKIVNGEKINIKISLATQDDAQIINELRYKTWLVTYPNQELGITVDDIHDRFKNIFSEESIQKGKEKLKQTDERLTLVAKQLDKIVGFCSCAKSEEKNQLQAIYILPEYQGIGVGKQLWERSLDFFDTHKDTVVEVAEYNSSAIKFYESLGFIDSGKRTRNEHLKLKSGSIIPEMEMIIKAK